MANPVIQIKRSAVPGKIPTTSNLQLGELAVNTYDGKVYIEQDQGAVGVGTTIVVINPWSVGLGSAAYNTYFTAGSVGIGTTLPKAALNVIGVVSATSFVGDGSQLTGISAGGGSQWVTTSAGIHTLSSVGIGTTNPTVNVTSANTAVLAAGIVTAYKFYGDGANLTGISAIARVTVQSTAPSSPTAGDLWYHTTLGRLFVYFNDDNSSQWVDAAPFNIQGSGAASVTVGSTAPSGPSSGDLWYNADYGRLFVYYKDGSSDQWVDAAPFNYSGITTSTYTENSFIATAGQTTFTVNYDVGYVQVYLNGIRLTSTEYTAATGTSVILTEAAALGDVVDILNVATNRGQTGAKGDTGSSTKNVYSYTATGLQTSFSASYSVGYVDVYLNGIKLTSSEYTATDGSTVVLTEGATVDDVVEIVGYQTYSIGAYAISAGIATNATYATSAGIATYATTAGISTYATTAGIATYSTSSGIATYATTSGISTYSTSSGIATYATTSGVSTTATTAGYATTSGISTVSQGLTGTPNITVGIITATNVTIGTANTALIVTGNTRISGATTITGNLNAPGNYYVKLARTSNQTITSGADALIGFTATSDTNGWYSGITTRTTPNVAGTYQVQVMLNWQGGASTNSVQSNIQVRKNGNTFAIALSGVQTFQYNQYACGIVTMNGTTDYIDFTAYTSNPTSQVVTGDAGGLYTKMEIFKLN